MVETAAAHPLSQSASKSASRRQLRPKLLDYSWVKELHSSTETVFECAAMEKKSQAVDPDHLFLSMLRQELVDDILFLWDDTNELFHCIIALGTDIAGHPRITHGGFTSAVVDEATGGLVYKLKHKGKLGEGPAFTARLEVDYRNPMPTETVIHCVAKIDYIEGRKIWTSAKMTSLPVGDEKTTLFAEGKALYVTPRPKPCADGIAPPATTTVAVDGGAK